MSNLLYMNRSCSTKPDGNHVQPYAYSTSPYEPISCCGSKTCGAKCRAANRRRVDEEPKAMLRSCSDVALSQMIEKYTLDHDWLIKKLAASDVEQVRFIHDANRVTSYKET